MTHQRLHVLLSSFPTRVAHSAWVYSRAPSAALLRRGRGELHLARLYVAAEVLLAALYGLEKRLQRHLTGAAHRRRVQRLERWLAAAEGGAV